MNRHYRCLLCVCEQKKGHLKMQREAVIYKKALSRNLISQHLTLGLSGIQNCE